jgi:ABC-type sulfate/molybdate transport systems ATPase subunit
MIEVDCNLDRGVFALSVRFVINSAWTVVFGPSGAGKSSLLRLIAGLDQPDSGRISVDSTILTDTTTRVAVPPGKRRIGYATQHPALFPHLTVSDNVGYGLLGVVPAERQTRVASMLEILGASGLINRPTRMLSGGEAQRVALARALAPEPRVLLLDEPLSALDAAARDALLDRMREWLDARQIQTVVVTHDAGDALATEAEVLLLENGCVTGQGPAAEVLATEGKRLLARLRAAITARMAPEAS